MASSGGFQNAFATGYTLRVEWKVNSQSNTANNSSMTVTAYLVSGGASYTISSSVSKTISLVINGVTYTKSATGLASLNGNQKKELFSKTVTIPHNTDGTKSVAISCAFGIEVTLSGSYYGTVSTSGTAELDKIAKGSVPTVSGSMAVGNTVTINTNRASTDFTHTLLWSLDQINWTQFAAGVETSTTWTLPSSMATASPASTNSVVYIRCLTYSGNTSIGTTVVSYKYYITSAYAAPTVSLSASQSNSAGIAKYIRGKSTITLTAEASTKYGASPAKYLFTYGGITKTVVSSVAKTSVSFELPADAAESYACSVTVTDTRGYTATDAESIATVAYAAPLITSVKAARGNYSGGTFTTSDDGEDLRLVIAATISPISNLNAKNYKVQYKLTTATAYTDYTQATAGSYSVSATVYIENVISVDYSYDVKVTVTDSFGEAFKVVDIATAFTLMDFNANGKGLAIGKVSEKDGFEVAVPMYDEFGMEYRNGLVYYASGGATDANTTLEECFISSGTSYNAPANGFWYIRQTFYSGKSVTANRMQYAIPYTAGGSHYRRNYNDGSWSKWYEIPVVTEKGTSGSWTYEKLSNGYAECWGQVSVSSLAVNTALGNWYRSAVQDGTNLPFTFSSTPVFTVDFSTSGGTGALVWLTGAGSTTATPTLYLIRPTSATSVSGTLNIHVRGKWA